MLLVFATLIVSDLGERVLRRRQRRIALRGYRRIVKRRHHVALEEDWNENFTRFSFAEVESKLGKSSFLSSLSLCEIPFRGQTSCLEIPRAGCGFAREAERHPPKPMTGFDNARRGILGTGELLRLAVRCRGPYRTAYID